MIIKQYTDAAYNIVILWRMANGKTLYLKFKEQPTTEQLEAIEARYLEDHQYDSDRQVEISLYDNIDLMKEVIRLVKERPNLTMTQYETYLATKQWYEACTIRYFVFRLATGLADHYGLTLDNYTEAQVLLKLRNWIVETPIKRIAKIVLGRLNNEI